MSAIETYLQYIANKVWARDVRTAIVNAIRQCYDDVHNPTLNTEAIQAAVQAKIDAGQMAGLTIGDGTLTGAKFADGTIPKAKLDPSITFDADSELDTTSTNAIQNKVVAEAISTVRADLGAQTGIIRMTKNAYIETNTTPISLEPHYSSAGRMYAVIDCAAGDKFVINAYSGFGAAKAWCFIDSSNNAISMADTDATVTDLELTAPTNAVKLIINDRSGGMSYKVGNNIISKVDSLGGNLTDFQIFKRDKRITPWTLKINFKSTYCFTVQKFLIPTEDGNYLVILPNGYDVDWRNHTDPSFIKILLMNDETKKLEVIDPIMLEPSFFSTHSYVGLVYAGSLYDIPVSFSAMNNDGVTQIFQYGLEHGYYAEHFLRHVGYYKLPKKVGVIGDSLSVGYVNDSSGTAHKRMLKYSWPKAIMADTGNPWLNLGQSGQTVLTWCSHNTYGKAQLEAAGNKCQMYIIGLGVNDANNSWGIPLGSSNDISSNPDRVATTYYGGYVRIIQLIKRVNQDAIIICLTNPIANTKEETYNEAIRYIVNTYYSDDTKVVMIDMYDKYRFLFTDPESVLYKDHIKPAAGGHFTASGYRMIATLMEYAIDDLLRLNSTFSDTIPFIDYDTGNPTDNTMIE